MFRFLAVFLLIGSASFLANPTTALAAPTLVATVQECDGLVPNAGAHCLPLVTGSPAVGGGILAHTEDQYTSGTGQCAGSVSCFTFTGSADSFSNFGALTLDGNQLASFQIAPAQSLTTYAQANFSDILHFSTGTQVRLTFTIQMTLNPGCGTGSGFNCDPTEIELDSAVHVLAGLTGSESDAAFITLGQLGTGAPTFLDDLTNLPPTLPHFRSTSCIVGAICGELMTDQIPIAGPLSLIAVVLADIRPFFAAPPNTIGGNFAMQVVLSKIELFDASNSPITQFTVTSDSGTAYPLQAPALPAPTLSVASNVVQFPNTLIGTTSAAQSVTVSNSGNAALVIGAIAVTGTDATSFATNSDTCSGQTLAANSTCTIGLTYSPIGTLGARNASLTIASNDAHSPTTLTLSGLATAPVISASLSSLTLDSTTVGQTSAAKTITITNSGNATLTIGTVTKTGTNPSEFSLTDNCSAQSLTPNSTCTVSVAFTPGAANARSAALSIPSNASNTSPLTISLSGTGVSPPPSPGGGGGQMDENLVLLLLLLVLAQCSFRKVEPRHAVEM